jgi:hypothetical protein
MLIADSSVAFSQAASKRSGREMRLLLFFKLPEGSGKGRLLVCVDFDLISIRRHHVGAACRRCYLARNAYVLPLIGGDGFRRPVGLAAEGHEVEHRIWLRFIEIKCYRLSVASDPVLGDLIVDDLAADCCSLPDMLLGIGRGDAGRGGVLPNRKRREQQQTHGHNDSFPVCHVQSRDPGKCGLVALAELANTLPATI